MNSNNLMARMEALLFVVGDEGMTVKQLAQLLEVDEVDIEAGLSELKTLYENNEHLVLH